MDRLNPLKHLRIKCTISSDGLIATVVQKEPCPKKEPYKEKFGGRGQEVKGKKYWERCYEWDLKHWVAVHEIKAKEFKIVKYERSLEVKHGEIYEFMFMTDDTVKII